MTTTAESTGIVNMGARTINCTYPSMYDQMLMDVLMTICVIYMVNFVGRSKSKRSTMTGCLSAGYLTQTDSPSTSSFSNFSLPTYFRLLATLEYLTQALIQGTLIGSHFSKGSAVASAKHYFSISTTTLALSLSELRLPTVTMSLPRPVAVYNMCGAIMSAVEDVLVHHRSSGSCILTSRGSLSAGL